MSPPAISEVVFTDPDTVRDVIHNFNRDGFNALYPRYRGGRPQTFTLPKRQEIKRIALTDPQDLDQPFAIWSLSKLADYLVAEGWSRTSPTRACVSSSLRKASAFKP
jgi:transposase